MNKNELHKRLIEVAAMSPAKKRKVGAVLVAHTGIDEYSIVSEGYNFNINGGPCETSEGKTHEDVIHAEMACISNIPDSNTWFDAYNITMFVTHQPCEGCQAGLLRLNIPYEVIGDFLKFDDNKPRVSLVPGSLVNEVGKVVTYGAKKYKVDNWRKVTSQERYWNALERHLIAFKQGETHDPESGLPHIAHIACNAAFLIELQHLPLRDEE